MKEKDKSPYARLEGNQKRGRVLIGQYCVFAGNAKEAAYWHRLLNDAWRKGLTDGLMVMADVNIENPRWIRRHERRITEASRALARKQRRSNNRLRAREALRRAHQSAVNARTNYLHHVSKWLVANYDLIAHEALAIRKMSRSARGTVEQPGKNVQQKAGLNRSIMDAAWGQLLFQLKYKAESAGAHVVAVNPRGTSIKCSRCGESVPKALSDRQHICGACGLSIDRDENAARNVLALGMSAVGFAPQNVYSRI